MSKPGKITQIIGAVIDVSFEGDLPEIYTALQVDYHGNKPILPPLAYGAKRSTTFIPVTNISVSVD